jgi:hypothetical protein
MSTDYVIVLKVRDNISGRSSKALKQKVAKAVNDAFKNLNNLAADGTSDDDISLFDIQVAEVV